MRHKFSGYIWLSTLLYAFLNLLVIFLLSYEETVAWSAGYLIGLLAVVVHLLSSLFNKESGEKQFVQVYYLSLFIRFLMVIALFIFILLTTKIDEFSFTVSFIFSYIFHSVNEVILLNRKFSN